MRESQDSIVAWATETFGPSLSVFRAASRANTEMAELVRAVSGGAPPAKIVEEAGDVAIVLCRVARLLGAAVAFEGSAATAVRPTLTKMAIHANRAMADLLIELGRPRPGVVHAIALIGRAFLFLRRLCEGAGTTLAAEVDAKMALNRQRLWKLDSTGHGQHVDGVAA